MNTLNDRILISSIINLLKKQHVNITPEELLNKPIEHLSSSEQIMISTLAELPEGIPIPSIRKIKISQKRKIYLFVKDEKVEVIWLIASK